MRLARLLLIVFLTACGIGKDNLPPVISWPFPSDKQTFTTGDTISWQTVVVDNRLLDSISLSLAPDFDIPAATPNLLPGFSASMQYAIGGDTRLLEYSFYVPDSVLAGQYRGVIMASDAAGNKAVSEKIFTMRNVLDQENPTIDSLFCPDSLQVGSTAQLFVAATDDTRLSYSHWEIKRTASDSLLAASIVPIDQATGTASFIWPGSNTIGQYRLQLTVGDWVNNQSKRTCNLLIYQ